MTEGGERGDWEEEESPWSMERMWGGPPLLKLFPGLMFGVAEYSKRKTSSGIREGGRECEKSPLP